MTNLNKNTQLSFRPHFKKAFNIYVGCGKQYSRQTIANILECTPRTVENWGTFNNDCVPGAYNLLMLQSILPDGFKSMIEDFFKNDESKNICLYRFNADFAKFMGDFAGMIQDKILDRKERNALKMDVPIMIKKLQELLIQVNGEDK